MSAFFSTLESFKNIYMFVCVSMYVRTCVSACVRMYVCLIYVQGYTFHSMYVVLRGQHCGIGSLPLLKVDVYG